MLRFLFVFWNSSAHTLQRPGSAASAAKQASEEHLKLLQTIQQQAEQISSLISTVNSQVLLIVVLKRTRKKN